MLVRCARAGSSRARGSNEGRKVRSPQGRKDASHFGRRSGISRWSFELYAPYAPRSLLFRYDWEVMYSAPECWNAGLLLPRLEQGAKAMALKSMLMLKPEWRRRSERGACVGNSALYTRCSVVRPCTPLRALRPPQASVLLPFACHPSPCLATCPSGARRDRRATVAAPYRLQPATGCAPLSCVDCPCGLDRRPRPPCAS